jgi:hypothetical protein
MLCMASNRVNWDALGAAAPNSGTGVDNPYPPLSREEFEAEWSNAGVEAVPVAADCRMAQPPWLPGTDRPAQQWCHASSLGEIPGADV